MTPTPTPASSDPDDPVGSDTPTEFHRLHLMVLTTRADPAEAIQEVEAQLAVLGRDDGGSPWTASLLFEPDGGPPEDGTCVVVTGEVAPPVTDPATQVRAFDLARLLRRAGSFPEVEPDLPVQAYAPPNRSGFGIGGDALPASRDRAWGRNQIFAEEAWALTPQPGGARKGRGVLIGHPDTGYTVHPSIGEIYALGLDADFIDPHDRDGAIDPLEVGLPLMVFPGHGTGTSSVMAAHGGQPRDGTFGGVAPEARVLPIRAVRSVIQFLDNDVAKAVDHARRNGCAVISMSLGGKGFFGLKSAIRRAVDEGIIVMAAAGNHVRVVTAPASYGECLAVAASNADCRSWSGSSRGRAVDITAPGESVWTAGWNLTTRCAHVDQSSGTSHAVAHLAGVAALWLSHHGVDELRHRYGGNLQWVFLELVQQTCTTPPEWDTHRFGPGIVHAEALLEAELPVLPAGFSSRVPWPPNLRPERDDRLSRIASTFPDLDPEQLSALLQRNLRLDESTLTDLLDEHGAELHFHFLNDLDLRNAVESPSGFTDGPQVVDILRASGSSGLVAHLAAR